MSMQIEKTVLIGGSPSSGSTLLSVMLDAHPEIHCGPEIGLLANSALYTADFRETAKNLCKRLQPFEWLKNDAIANLEAGFCPYALIDESNLASYGHSLDSVLHLLSYCESVTSFLERLYMGAYSKHGKAIWAEKTPSNLYAFEAFLNFFPAGRVLYVVRDPRAVIASLLKRGMGLRRAISIWLVEVAICERLASHPRVLRVRYEDLVRDTASTLHRVITFLNVAPEVSTMLRYNETSDRINHDTTLKSLESWNANPTQPITTTALDAWREDLDSTTLSILANSEVVRAPSPMQWAEGIRLFDLAARLGYALDHAPASEPDVWERLIGERLFCVKDQVFDSNVFHERFVESHPILTRESSADLWSAVVEGTRASYGIDRRLHDELCRVRSACDHWHHEYSNVNQALSETSVSKDDLERRFALIATENTNLKAEMANLISAYTQQSAGLDRQISDIRKLDANNCTDVRSQFSHESITIRVIFEKIHRRIRRFAKRFIDSI